MKSHSVIVEFFGGPFDGHTQTVRATPNELSKNVTLPINENVFLMLNGKERGEAKPSKKIAIYQLHIEKKARRCMYRHVKDCLASEVLSEDWMV